VNLVERLVAARAAWLEVEAAAAALHDPQAIEHATIAGLAMLHLAERAIEIDDRELRDDLMEVLADELDLERYGDVDEAAA
jgi:hypothetical protein